MIETRHSHINVYRNILERDIKIFNPCLTAGEDVKRFRKQAGFKKSWRSLSREGTGVTLTKSYLWYPNHLYRRLCLLSIHVGSMWTWIHHLDCVSRDGKPAAWKYKPFLLKIQLQPTSIFGLVYKLITSSLIHHVIFKARHVTYCKISDITIMTSLRSNPHYENNFDRYSRHFSPKFGHKISKWKNYLKIIY